MDINERLMEPKMCILDKRPLDDLLITSGSSHSKMASVAYMRSFHTITYLLISLEYNEHNQDDQSNQHCQPYASYNTSNLLCGEIQSTSH